MKDYQPIDCGYHDELESLCTRKTTCKIDFLDRNHQVVSVETRIIDVYALSGEEFLKIESGEVIRLDRLVSVNGKRVSNSC